MCHETIRKRTFQTQLLPGTHWDRGAKDYYIFFNYSLMLAVLKVDLGEEAEPCWFVASTHTLSSLWLDTSIGEI